MVIEKQNSFNKISYVAKRCTIFLFLIVLLIGLPQINMLKYVQSTVTSKFIVFAYGSIIIFSVYALRIIISKPKTLHFSKLDIGLFILFSYITLNRYALQVDFNFSIRYLELLGLAVIYIVLRGFHIKNYVWFLLAIIISGIIQAIYGNLQLLGYYPSNHSGFKLTGSFFNPGPYAGFLAVVWPMTLGMYLLKDKIIEQVQSQIRTTSKITNTIISYALEYIPLLGVISIILIIPATHSRGAWLAILLSSLVLIEYRYHFIKHSIKKITRIKKIALAFLVLSIFFSGLLGVYYFKKGSSDGRLFIWKVTTEIIKDYPVFGIGFDRFKAHYMNYQADYFDRHGETEEALVADNTYYAFNEGLQFIVENGLIGLVLLLFLIYYIYKVRTDKQDKYLYLCLVSGLLGTGVFAFFSYPMQILPIKLVLVVLLALLSNLNSNKYTFFKKPKQFPFVLFKTAILILGAIGSAKGIEHTIALEQSFKTWKNALNSYQYGNYQEASILYAEAYPVLKKDGDFLMNYGKALTMHKQNEKAVRILKEAKQHINTTIIETTLGDAYKGIKQYDKAEIAYQQAANMIPVRFYPMYLLAKLYEESEEKMKSIKMAKEILKKEIKIPSTAIKEIQAEMRKIVDTEK